MNEVFSAMTMDVGHARYEIVLASIGYLLHAPWSFTSIKHIIQMDISSILDTSGIHLHSILTGYSWYYMFGTYEQFQM